MDTDAGTRVAGRGGVLICGGMLTLERKKSGGNKAQGVAMARIEWE